jgi:tryptophanyl-tRNA synthetase
MSSSKPDSALFTKDDPDLIEKKVKNTFTGGQPTVSLQRKLGGNADICPVYWYLKYLFDNEEESIQRYNNCKGGSLLCGDCKNDLIKDVKPFIKDIQRKREKAKDMIKEFMIDGKDLDYKDKK